MRNGRLRRSWAVLLVGATAGVLAALAGCGVIGEKYVYIEWYTHYYEKYFPGWIEEFESEHSDEHVRVKFRAMVQGSQEMVYTMLISHTLADVIVVANDTAALLMENGALEPVGDDELDREDFMEISLKLASDQEGRLVGYPSGAGIRPFMYYDGKLLEAAGTSAAEAPETFAEYREWASKLFEWELDGKEVLGALSGEELDRAVMKRRPLAVIRGFVRSGIPYLLAYVDPIPDANGKSDGSIDDFLGGPPSWRPFRFDTPEVIKGLEEYEKIFLPGKSAMADGNTGRMLGFKQGLYAGMEGANWIYGEVFTIDIAVTRAPRAEGRAPRLWMNATSMGVSRESKHKELSKEFAKFISSADAQMDAYYGHGYLPCRFSAWDRLEEQARVDKEIRGLFLGGAGEGSEIFVGAPQVKRLNHEDFDVVLYAPYEKDEELLSVGGEDEKARKANLKHMDTAERLQREISEYVGSEVRVVVQGTPEEMLASRSFCIESPIPVYKPLLADAGVYVPYVREWSRLDMEVLTRMFEFVTRPDNAMSAAEAAAWAQKEAEDIVAGRK